MSNIANQTHENRQRMDNNSLSAPERKNTEDIGAKGCLPGQKESKRTEYPGFYTISGEFNKEENDRKTLRFNNKNKLLFDEAILNLKETFNMLGLGQNMDHKERQ